ncbi:hypothetical protein ATCVBr0604L_306R [Acanthocystis turfacea Chlorella virus Br0604L]|nr:hypothetical protein ATCVBr0604L_306R [Acanthocystis turfacea Chlorella virus Br0604L]
MAAGTSFGLILFLTDDALLDASSPVAIQAIIDFAEGKDGKLGTADDRMSPRRKNVYSQVLGIRVEINTPALLLLLIQIPPICILSRHRTLA